MIDHIDSEEFEASKVAFIKAVKQSQPQLAIANLMTFVLGLEEQIDVLRTELESAKAATPKRATAKVADSEA